MLRLGPRRVPTDDDVLLAAVLRRFLLTDGESFFFIRGDRLVLDGVVRTTGSECAAMLRVTRGQVDASGLHGFIDPRVYTL